MLVTRILSLSSLAAFIVVAAVPGASAQPATPVTSLQGAVMRQALPVASLTATIEQEVKRPYPGPPSKFVAITLRLQNPGEESVMLDGDNAVAFYSDGSQVKNASEKAAVADANRSLTKHQKMAVAVVTLATATLAGPLFYEWIQGGASNPKLSLGVDELRRRIEGLRLGSRLLLANEVSEGTVFLPADQGMPTYIVIPVLSSPGRQNVGVLRVDIAGSSGTQH